LPKPKTRQERNTASLQSVEDAVEINVAQINKILGRPGVARYSRATERGEIYERYFGKTKVAKHAGAQALESVT
jgi:hypothetical protein